MEASPSVVLQVLSTSLFETVSHRTRISPIRRGWLAGQQAAGVLCPAFPALDWKRMPPTHLGFLHWFGGLNSGCQACVTQLFPEFSNVSPTACGLKATRKMFKPRCREAARLHLHAHGSDFSTARLTQITQGPGCNLLLWIFPCPAWGYSLGLE